MARGSLLGAPMRLGLLFVIASSLLLACGGATEGAPAAPSPDEIVEPAGSLVGVRRLAGSQSGVALSTGGSLRVYRPDGARLLVEGDVESCPWSETDRVDVWTDTLVVRDGVILSRSSCGAWMYRDGETTPELLASPDGRWRGGDGPRYHGPLRLAVSGDRLFACVAPGRDLDRPAQIWSVSLSDGLPPRKLDLELGLNWCDHLLVDGDAFYVDRGRAILRIARDGSAPAPLAEEPGLALIESMSHTATHVYWVTNDTTQRTRAVKRVPKRGGAVETVAVDATDIHALSESANVIFASRGRDILEISGLSARVVLSADAYAPRFAVSMATLFWVRDDGALLRRPL